MTRLVMIASALLTAGTAQADMLIMRRDGSANGSDQPPPYTFTFRVGSAVLSHTFDEGPLLGLSHTWRPGDEGWEQLIGQLEDNELDATAVGINGSEFYWQNENVLNHNRPNLYGFDYINMNYQWSGITVWVHRIFGEPVNSAVFRIEAFAVPEPSGLGLLLGSGVLLPWRLRGRSA